MVIGGKGISVTNLTVVARNLHCSLLVYSNPRTQNHNSNKINYRGHSFLTYSMFDVEFLSPKRKCDFTLVPMDRKFYLCYIGEVWNALNSWFLHLDFKV